MLTSDQQWLLRRLVQDSVLGVGRGQPKEFYALYTSRDVHITCVGSSDHLSCSRSDLDVLVRYKLIQPADYDRACFYVTNEGLNYAAKMDASPAIDEVFKNTISLVQQQFPDEYRVPIQLVESAAKKLLVAQDEHSLTEIGHMCRDAIQGFAQIFYSVHCPTDKQEVDLPKNKNLKRVRQVLSLWKEGLGDTKVDLLTALFDYYEQTSNLLQKVEHGSEQGRRQLTWDDTRLAVLSTYLIMSELLRAERLRK